MGAFADAHFRVFGNNEESRRTMRALLAPLRAHVREAGLGHDRRDVRRRSTAHPAGLFRPAWSEGEIARVLYTHMRGGE